ncbi:MAG TPA: argininosuccinate lyase [Thermodesulfobacteriaceae bacterium]|nr:argininosuccinate lyase [Thermodesulfobacteriaceae bacterium]
MTERENMPEKPWGGRFREKTEKLLEEFSASVQFDCRLFRQDIAGSRAHARMLGKQGIISQADVRAICRGLDEIEKEIESGAFEWRQDLEDVHMNIERALVAKIGEAGKRLHTARSRNDQVATDVRLYLRGEIDRIDLQLADLQEAFLHQAEKFMDLPMPGYTHLQRAQPVLWAHHMLAYFEMTDRDRERLMDCRKRVNLCPLGSAALAGTGFPIDRDAVARELGFIGITANSLDSVGDRDFIVEFLSAASLIMAHLSRLSEELILWSSREFGFIELPDGFCTGSSIMPQKKNPDVPELVRGKTGRVYGNLMSVLTVVKALPLAYNRDLQEDKEALLDTIDTVSSCVEITAALVSRMTPRKGSLSRAVSTGFLTATDMADYLVNKGVPFREAHAIVGKAVSKCIARGVELTELTIEELKAISSLIEEDVFEVLSVTGSLEARKSSGGTAPSMVERALKEAKKRFRRRKREDLY